MKVAPMDIGFIGLGHMGYGMARNLLKAGHRLTVYNRTRARAEAVAADGAQLAESVADACRGEIVITMLADDEAVEAVTFGKDGILSTLARNAIHLSCSTISVALSDRLTEAHKEAGQHYAAAPVLGRPEAAAAGKLFIVAAGAQQVVHRCQPVFSVIGQRFFEVGKRPSLAILVKLSGNFLIAAMIESLGEAIALVRKGGLQSNQYVDIITSTLFNAPAYKTYGAIIAEERYEPAGFPVAMGLKDIRLALAAGETAAVPMPVASLVRDHFLEAEAQGGSNSDWASLARVCARNAGL
jgi:3-hydroxyisobutyrate dehydrogenase-like beta-hydroxyacid dehydrogenase